MLGLIFPVSGTPLVVENDSSRSRSAPEIHQQSTEDANIERLLTIAVITNKSVPHSRLH